jgi:hypothetical protein
MSRRCERRSFVNLTMAKRQVPRNTVCSRLRRLRRRAWTVAILRPFEGSNRDGAKQRGVLVVFKSLDTRAERDAELISGQGGPCDQPARSESRRETVFFDEQLRLAPSRPQVLQADRKRLPIQIETCRTRLERESYSPD